MKTFLTISLILFLPLFNFLVGGFAVQYILQTIGTHLAGQAVHVSFLVCALAGLFVAELAIPAALFTYLLHLLGVI